MEADIAIQGDKVKAITAATRQFAEEKGEATDVSPTSGLAFWHTSLDKSPSFRVLLPPSPNGARKKFEG